MINVVSISGGKDSTATLLLALERGVENIRPVFADTGHEHPITYDYIQYLEQRLGISVRRVKGDFRARIAAKREYIVANWAKDGVPDDRIQAALDTLVVTGNPFLDMCIWKGRFPSPRRRFCTEELKVLPMIEQVILPATAEGEVAVWQGVRADESASRAKLPERDKGEVGEWNYRPILTWTVDDVFSQHRKHDVDPNPLYRQGMGRVGCMPCIMARKGELSEMFRRWPDVVEKLRRWEMLVSRASKQSAATFLDARIPAKLLDDENIHFTTHGIDFMAKWAQTSRGGRQADLLQTLEPAACNSIYGLCE